MGMTTIAVKIGQRPTKDQLQEVREAVKLPLVHDSDCLPSNAEALADFAVQARALRREIHSVKPAVTIRLDPDCLEIYKSLGRGYTGIMADVLAYAAAHPEVLNQSRS